ncbi:MAG TPA: hypothetical protein VFS21_01705 [Roseiflexaceae bacterium]|nr:hypothetical protein [Roseiflexaceae bacterium]
MTTSEQFRRRRAFLRVCLSAPAALLLPACSAPPQSQTAAPTAAPAAPTAAPTAVATAAGPTAVPTVAPTAVPPTAAPTTASTTAPTAAPAAALPPTPACGDDDDEPTIAQTEGPYFTPNSPERASLLEPGMAGTRLILAGQVLSTGCAPVGRALVDIWHANDAGEYDNTGYTLRGHQYTDEQGRYRFETIVPGLYPGRTRHIHVKVQAPGGPVLTTQVYFPDESRNARDSIYNPTLLVEQRDTDQGREASFTFVV